MEEVVNKLVNSATFRTELWYKRSIKIDGLSILIRHVTESDDVSREVEILKIIADEVPDLVNFTKPIWHGRINKKILNSSAPYNTILYPEHTEQTCLIDLIYNPGDYSTDSFCHIISEIYRMIHALHSIGVVHGNIIANKIYVTWSGDEVDKVWLEGWNHAFLTEKRLAQKIDGEEELGMLPWRHNHPVDDPSDFDISGVDRIASRIREVVTGYK
jgi:hypothetical protein